jgi:hypothetical protein
MENYRLIFSLKKKRFIIGRSASGQRVRKRRSYHLFSCFTSWSKRVQNQEVSTFFLSPFLYLIIYLRNYIHHGTWITRVEGGLRGHPSSWIPISEVLCGGNLERTEHGR